MRGILRFGSQRSLVRLTDMRFLRLSRQTLPLVLVSAVACATAERMEAVHLLKDIEARGRPSELKSITPAPRRTTITYHVMDRTSVADVYEPNQTIGAGLVLVPGFTPQGKDDRRIVDLAFSLARARFLVLVPDLPGLREIRVHLTDTRVIADAMVHLAGMEVMQGHGGVGVVAISYAVGLAALASALPDAQDKIQFLVSIGGYYDAKAVVTFITTGKYRDQSTGMWRSKHPHPAAKRIFLASSIDVLSDPDDRTALGLMAERRVRRPSAPIDDLTAGLGPDGRALLELFTNTDPDRVEGLIARLPSAPQRQLDKLSLRHASLSSLAGRLILIHGREDTMIPYTESLAFKEAIGDAELFLVDGFSHIGSRGLGPSGRSTLIDAVRAVLRRRR